jgi:predicted transcriptional regulator
VAKELVEKHNFLQIEAAKKLGTTQAAISYYLYTKRGKEKISQLEAVPVIRRVANEVAQGIAGGKISASDAMLRFCKLCMALRKRDVICDMHRDSMSLPEICDICSMTFEGREAP